MGRDVGASFPEPVVRFGVAEGKGGLEAGTVVLFGQAQDGINQAGAGARGQVPGCGAQRRPGLARARPGAALDAGGPWVG
jgi:hypothetical protein